MTAQEEKTTGELILEFEREIRFDVHSTRARVSRSHAGRELRRRGRDALGAIPSHLWANRPRNSDWDMEDAWRLLMSWIFDDLGDPKGERPGDHIHRWIEWAIDHADAAAAPA